MRIALSSHTAVGAWFALRLIADGHKVDYYLSKPEFADVCGGMLNIKHTDIDHRRNAIGYPSYERYDLSLFDVTGKKKQADFSRTLCPTIGDGSVNCLLEDDRMAGIKAMEEAGIKVPPYEEFTNIGAAKAYVKKNQKRYVFKPDSTGGEQDAATTYVAKSAEDLLEYFDKLSSLSKGVKFILQEFIPGTECSVEGWFNGSEFYCLNATIEDKKFMSGNIGPNTGCAGNLVFTISSKSRIFQKGLELAKVTLKDAGYCGMIDLNSIITESGELYGLEWTPRLGYDAGATLACMYGGDYGELLFRTATGKVPQESWRAPFGVSIRLSIPPYPTDIKMPKLAGIPIKGIDPEDVEQIKRTYLYDVKLEKKKLITGGLCGFIAAPVVIGTDLTKAFDTLERQVKEIQIPDMQYRDDLKKSIQKRYYELEYKGWF